MDHIFTGNNWPYISSRLRSRLVLFLVIAFALIIFGIYEVATGVTTWQIGLISFIIGGVLGYIYGRLVRVHWNADEEKIVTRLDTIGFIIIIIYVIFSYFRDTLLAHFFTGAALTAIGLIVAGGILIGRFFGMHVSLMRTLREHRPAVKNP
jgi:peptidoglycan/LPS O-acetylase OafA/YrhL